MSIALFTLLSALMTINPAVIHDEDQSLVDAISTFNDAAANDPIGQSQPPLTASEVIAAIRFWKRPNDKVVSEELLTRFQRIAESKTLPPGATLESLRRFDPGGNFIFDVWSVRLRIQRADKSTFDFLLRQRVVSSCTLTEELDRLEKYLLANPESARNIGFNSIENQIGNLKKRIAEHKATQ